MFVSLHHPPYTKSRYHSKRKSERILADLFENYKEKKLSKVDIVFSGHAHNYERYKHNGINYVVSGGGGASQYAVKREPGDFYTRGGETFHYCKVTVSNESIFFEMIRIDLLYF